VGYYTRVLTQHPYCIHFNDLVAHIDREGWRAELVIEDGTPTNWEQLALSHTGGDEIAIIERNSVENSGLGAEEIDEFISEIQACKPKSAAAWLIEYLRSVKTIYSFQHLHGATHSNGDQILRSISNLIWSQGRAILQADGEKFSNEEGYHILWQFLDGNRSGGERMCSISDHVALVLGSAKRTSTTPIRRGVYSMAWRSNGETLNSRSRPRRLPS